MELAFGWWVVWGLPALPNAPVSQILTLASPGPFVRAGAVPADGEDLGRTMVQLGIACWRALPQIRLAQFRPHAIVRPMHQRIAFLLSLTAMSTAQAQSPRCDAILTDAAKTSPDWQEQAVPPQLTIGANERLIMARCGSCDPPVAAMLRTTDLTGPDKLGRVLGPASAETIADALADPVWSKN